ncbi:alkaline phosphatase family protein [Pararobbsia alpina]|uniref:Phospholipase C 1 n=1 Tax=Pararobbsia alpina TaxID=621374 RepID=A0A6S7B866_9BURK|nr:alkaline phosphatase family protein [Pararobbsia alpina]CAB3791130.1 Phospholipase C 1 [Pararobbsia alpina]
MDKILDQIEHVVVVMLENRSLDTLLGWLYAQGERPNVVLPAGSPATFDGLRPDMWNPSDPGFYNGGPTAQVFVKQSASQPTVPDPDPQETFDNVTYQIFGPGPVSPLTPNTMKGFVINYATTSTQDASQVLEGYSTAQLPVLAALARSYAVSDAWFASVPTQTWPNRAFAHAGTSNGNVNNGDAIPDPFDWDVPTIFNVLESQGDSWSVYTDTTLVPSLTRAMFPKLWDPWLDSHFEGFGAFVDACEKDRLPRYSFIEPSFLTEPNDMHPPHDTRAGDAFLYSIWKAISTSPGWAKTLLIITFDEHGGCFDHVLPPFNAMTPDQASSPGKEGFRFDRFGIRVPTVIVSPYIAAGTVFRSPTDTPYDHTSILATLRDWLGIPASAMLPSARIAKAPTLDAILTLSDARTDLPNIAAPLGHYDRPALTAPPNDLQKSLVAASARRFGLDPKAAVASMDTRQHIVDFFKRRLSHAAS